MTKTAIALNYKTMNTTFVQQVLSCRANNYTAFDIAQLMRTWTSDVVYVLYEHNCMLSELERNYLITFLSILGINLGELSAEFRLAVSTIDYIVKECCFRESWRNAADRFQTHALYYLYTVRKTSIENIADYWGKNINLIVYQLNRRDLLTNIDKARFSEVLKLADSYDTTASVTKQSRKYTPSLSAITPKIRKRPGPHRKEPVLETALVRMSITEFLRDWLLPRILANPDNAFNIILFDLPNTNIRVYRQSQQDWFLQVAAEIVCYMRGLTQSDLAILEGISRQGISQRYNNILAGIHIPRVLLDANISQDRLASFDAAYQALKKTEKAR